MGYTKRPGEGVGSKLLRPMEDLERLADLTPEAPVLDKKTKGEYRKKAEPLAANITTVDQVKAKDAEPVQDQLHLNALGLQDSLSAAYFEKVRAQHAESLDLIAQGKPPITELDDKQLRTLYALTQDSLSREEAHMLRMIEPLMTPVQRETYLGVRQADYNAERAAPSLGETVKLGAEVVSPFLLPAGAIPLGRALGLSGNPLTIAIAITATVGMMGAEYMQKHAMGSRSSALYGVNVLADPNAGNDLMRLRARAEETAKLPVEKRDANRLQTDLAMFEEVLALRKAAVGGNDAPVVAWFERHVSDLKAALAAGGKPPPDLGAKFLADTAKVNLEELSANLRPTSQISEADFKKGMNVVVDALVKEMLKTANPALDRLLVRLDREYGINDKLAKGEKVPALPEHEVEAIRAVASRQPNFPETLGLGPLAISGAIDIARVWPSGNLTISNQETIDLRSFLKDIEKMRFGEDGDRLQLLGKIVDHGSQAVSVGAMSLVLLLGGGLFSVPAAIVPRILGVIAGNKLKQQGLELEAAQGVDLAKGRPMTNEFEVLLDRYRSPGALVAGDAAAIKKQLGQELALIQTLLKSVQAELAQYDQQGQASWLRYRAPVYAALADFGNAMHDLAASDGDVASLRAGFSAARQKLFAPDVLRQVNQQLIRDAAYLDAENDPFVKYCTAKLKMLDQVEQIVSSRTESFADVVRGWEKSGVRNTEIFRAATELRDLRTQIEAQRSKGILNYIKRKLGLYKGPELDAVDKFAISIIDQRFKTSSLSAIVDVTRASNEVAQKITKELKERWPVDEDRAKEIAGELVSVIMSRTMATVGPWSYQDMPKVKVDAEVKKVSEDPPQFAVTGTIDGGRGERGSIAVTVLAAGICDPASIKIDLGAGLLSRVARAAIEGDAAIEQARVEVKSAEVIGRPVNDGDDYLFRVATRANGAFTVAVTPDGFARLETIKTA